MPVKKASIPILLLIFFISRFLVETRIKAIIIHKNIGTHKLSSIKVSKTKYFSWLLCTWMLLPKYKTVVKNNRLHINNPNYSQKSIDQVRCGKRRMATSKAGSAYKINKVASSWVAGLTPPPRIEAIDQIAAVISCFIINFFQPLECFS